VFEYCSSLQFYGKKELLDPCIPSHATLLLPYVRRPVHDSPATSSGTDTAGSSAACQKFEMVCGTPDPHLQEETKEMERSDDDAKPGTLATGKAGDVKVCLFVWSSSGWSNGWSLGWHGEAAGQWPQLQGPSARSATKRSSIRTGY